MDATEEENLPDVMVRSSSSKSTGTAASGSLMSGLSDIVQNIDEVGTFNLSRENSDIENNVEITDTDEIITSIAKVSSSSSGSAGASGMGGILSPGGELGELVSGIDDVDRIPTDEYIDIAGMHHSSPIKGFTFGTTPDISTLTNGTNINVTPSPAFLKSSPSLPPLPSSSSQQVTSKAEVLLSWKYKSGASGHNKPSLIDTYRMQMEGLRRGNGDISSRLGIAGKNKSSRHMDKKKRRPNGSSTNGDDIVGVVPEKKGRPKKSSNKSESVSSKKDSKKTEEDLLWEHEMGRTDYYYPDDQQRLQDLTVNWEKKWEDDDDDDDEIVDFDDDDEDGNDDDNDTNDGVDDDDINVDVEDDNVVMNRSVDSDDDSDSMASLSSGLDSVTLDALMEIGSNHSASMNDDYSCGIDGGGDLKIMSSSFVPANASTFTSPGQIQKATPVLNTSVINNNSVTNTGMVNPAAVGATDGMNLSPPTLRTRSTDPSPFSTSIETRPNTQQQIEASKLASSPPSASMASSSISETVFHGVRQAVREQVVARIVTGSKKTNRGKYKCGRCGQSKQGHICEYVLQTDVCSTGTQVENWGVGNHPFRTEKTLSVRIREINLVNDSAVVNNTDEGYILCKDVNENAPPAQFLMNHYVT